MCPTGIWRIEFVDSYPKKEEKLYTRAEIEYIADAWRIYYGQQLSKIGLVCSFNEWFEKNNK